MFVGIDIGGTNIRVVTGPTVGEIVLSNEISIDTPSSYKDGIQALTEIIKKLEVQVDGIAIGLPGSVNSDGELTGSFHLKDWVGHPLAKTLAAEFSTRVTVRNDAEMGALGEAYCGNWGEADFLYLTWGTGFGVAQARWHDREVIVDRPENREAIYELDRSIGGNNLLQRYGLQAASLDDEQWNEVMIELTDSLPKLAKQYQHDTIVLSGGVSIKQTKRIEAALQSLKTPNVYLTKLKGKAGLYGALALLKNK